MKRLLGGCLLVALTATTTLAVGAPPSERARAKEAYDRGVDAHKRGEMKRAAEEFARADTIAPSAIALRAALDAAIEADDVALGAELLERSKRDASPPAGLAASITSAHLKFNGRAGRVRVVCPPRAICIAKIDEEPVNVDKPVWATAGQRSVSLQVDGGAPQTKMIEVTADQTVEVSPATKGQPPIAQTAPESPPPAEPGPVVPPPRREEAGLPPVFFYGGVGLTVVLAGLTTYFAVATAGKHGDFTDEGCDRVYSPACQGLKDDGQSRQTATNVGLALTAVAAIATGVVGVVLTNWHRPTMGLRPGRGGGSFGVAF